MITNEANSSVTERAREVREVAPRPRPTLEREAQIRYRCVEGRSP